MKNGFTLIELLAVIVILAVIALIATPIVLSIINDTKESAVIRSAEFYVDAVQSKIMQENMKLGGTLNPKECIVNTEGNVTCNGTNLEIEVNGQKPSGGSITFNEGKVTGINLTFGDKNVSMNTNGQLVFTEEIKLLPGLYDENDNLLISWEDLTSLEYKSFSYIDDWGEKVISPILSVDENGVLKTLTDEVDSISYSRMDLVGKLVIDDSVTSIGDYAFGGCYYLTNVIIPNSVTSIGSGAFFSSGLTNLEIPSSVISIDEYAFMECRSLTNIEIPNSISNITRSIFETSGLVSVTILASVTNIDYSAFLGSSGLAIINYRGTELEWNAIHKGEDWDYGTPSDKVINYNYTG